MGRLSEGVLVSLLIVFLINTASTWARKSPSVRKPSTNTNKGTSHSKPSSSQPGNYPRQPQSPGRDPYPAGGSYPYPGNTNQGGYPRQNQPNYPGGGSYPNQNPGRANPGGYPNQNPGGYPNQNPAGYPNQNPAGYPNRNPGGYPNQNPAGYPNQNPAGYPNQNPAGYPNRNPAFPPGAGQPGGGYPNQYPGRAGYPNQYPAGGGYPNQYPGGFPAAGGFGGAGAGGYPIRTGNTGPGWGAPAAYPGGYPGGAVGGYPNWNPNNKILSPRFGGGGYGYGGYGMGGSPFSHSVQKMGYQPKSTGFAKKAMLAAGVGAVAGMAVGYGLGRFPRPHFNFRNPEEEYYYNNYMYRRYGTQSTDQKDYGRDYVYKPPPRAETYENFMARCMNRTDLLKGQRSSSTTPKSEGDKEDEDVVSIEEIGYPALIEQMKARRCVEEYMVQSEKYLQERKAEQQFQPSRSSPLGYGVIQLFTSLLMLLSSMLLLQ